MTVDRGHLLFGVARQSNPGNTTAPGFHRRDFTGLWEMESLQNLLEPTQNLC
jgi:hypothetical protein